MSRFYRVVTLCGLVFLFFFVIPAHADTMYYIAGSATLVGNNACGASPCTEWVNFSFDLGWQLLDLPTPTYQAYTTNLVANWSGAIGPFTQNGGGGYGYFYFPNGSISGPCSGSGDFNYLPLFNPELGEIDINLCNNIVPAPEYPWISTAGQLYSCVTAACVTDFAPSYLSGATLPLESIRIGATVEATATLIPEPATLTLLAFGLLALALVGAFSRKLQHWS